MEMSLSGTTALVISLINPLGLWDSQCLDVHVKQVELPAAYPSHSFISEKHKSCFCRSRKERCQKEKEGQLCECTANLIDVSARSLKHNDSTQTPNHTKLNLLSSAVTHPPIKHQCKDTIRGGVEGLAYVTVETMSDMFLSGPPSILLKKSRRCQYISIRSVQVFTGDHETERGPHVTKSIEQVF